MEMGDEGNMPPKPRRACWAHVIPSAAQMRFYYRYRVGPLTKKASSPEQGSGVYEMTVAKFCAVY
jgi:hypothetical protein